MRCNVVDQFKEFNILYTIPFSRHPVPLSVVFITLELHAAFLQTVVNACLMVSLTLKGLSEKIQHVQYFGRLHACHRSLTPHLGHYKKPTVSFQTLHI